ncbi:MAG: hypothetical protein AB7Q37_01945 [Pyrinomonadaceae bacterium]
MNITDGSPQRRQLGVERFVSGEESLIYEGVIFWRSPEGLLVVSSYSDFGLLQNVTRDEAARKIERSMQVLEHLKAKIPAFGAAITGLSCKFEICFDSGKSAVKVASLEGGKIKWWER